MGAELIDFSLAERERRWTAVHRAMEAEGIGCLVTPPMASALMVHQAAAMYLAGCPLRETSACILPLGGKPTLLVQEATDAVRAGHWIEDVRVASHAFYDQILKTVQELASRTAMVGLVGMTDDGPVSTALMRRLVAALPQAAWVPFDGPLRAVRALKSAEEVQVLQDTELALERSFDEMAAHIRPRAPEEIAWAAAVAEQARRGGGQPRLMGWGSGARPELGPRVTYGTLERGMLVIADIEASVEGYGVRGCQPFVVEACDPAYVDLYRWVAELWQVLVARLAPGETTLGVQQAAEKLGSSLVPPEIHFEHAVGVAHIHGCGLGDDAPSTRRTSATALTEGMVVTLSAQLRASVGGRPYEALWRDAVEITSSGPHRLGARPVGLRIVGAPD